jgi:hypothetical protein
MQMMSDHGYMRVWMRKCSPRTPSGKEEVQSKYEIQHRDGPIHLGLSVLSLLGTLTPCVVRFVRGAVEDVKEAIENVPSDENMVEQWKPEKIELCTKENETMRKRRGNTN